MVEDGGEREKVKVKVKIKDVLNGWICVFEKKNNFYFMSFLETLLKILIKILYQNVTQTTPKAEGRVGLKD